MSERVTAARAAELLAGCGLSKVDFADLRMVSRAGDSVSLEDGVLHTACRLVDQGFFLRICSSGQWTCGSTNMATELPALARELRELADSLSRESGNEEQTSRGIPDNSKDRPRGVEIFRFTEASPMTCSIAGKVRDLTSLDAVFASFPSVVTFSTTYTDILETRAYADTLGTSFAYDKAGAGVAASYTLSRDGKNFRTFFMKGMSSPEEISGLNDELREDILEAEGFLQAANVEADDYPVVLAPPASGVFCHESFGHKSEADLMLGDLEMLKEWQKGMTVGSSMLSIVDEPLFQDSLGFTPFDDEGTAGKKTYLIKDGILTGRLHSIETALDLGETPTGNARGMSYGYEPIVRMTTTYIVPGSSSIDDLVSGVKLGVYVKTVSSGSGMSTFTMAPDRCYMIRDGKIAEPVLVSVVSGSVFETLGLIDGISDTLVIQKAPFIGCGKMEQFPLGVGIGGPTIRVSKMRVS